MSPCSLGLKGLRQGLAELLRFGAPVAARKRNHRVQLLFFRARLFSIALKGSRRAREAHKPFVPRGHRLCEVQLASARNSPSQGRERTVGMAECPRPLDEGGSKGRHGCVGQECGPAGNKHSDQAAPLAPWLARGRAQRRLPRHSTGPRPRRPRQPSGSAPSGAAPGMSALCGRVQGQGRRLEHDHPGGRAAPSRTREIPTWCHGEPLPAPQQQAVGNDLKPPVVDTIDLEIHVCQAGVASHPRPGLARRPAREGTRGSGGHRPEPREAKGRQHRQ